MGLAFLKQEIMSAPLTDRPCDTANSRQERASTEEEAPQSPQGLLKSRSLGGICVWKQSTRSGIRQAFRWALAATVPHRLFLTQGPCCCGSVCLTFDDGPDPFVTPRLLDVLREHGVRATFFVIGEKVARHPEIVRRIAAEGHCVGGHSFHHGDPGLTSSRQLREEIRRTADLLAPLVGRKVTLFRPPHGKLTVSKLCRLWRAGQTIVLWNADPKDYSRAAAQEVRDWFEGHPLRGGDLVLMHDNVGHAIDVIPDLSEAIRASGLSFATVSDWLT